MIPNCPCCSESSGEEMTECLEVNTCMFCRCEYEVMWPTETEESPEYRIISNPV